MNGWTTGHFSPHVGTTVGWAGTDLHPADVAFMGEKEEKSCLLSISSLLEHRRPEEEHLKLGLCLLDCKLDLDGEPGLFPVVRF